MKITSIDHLVLTVKDMPTTIFFYLNVLGMDTITFGENRKALAFDNQKINLHQEGNEFEPKAHHFYERLGFEFVGPRQFATDNYWVYRL